MYRVYQVYMRVPALYGTALLPICRAASSGASGDELMTISSAFRVK
jgi:hypothetical protein